METAYTFVWLSPQGDIAAIDSARCISDPDALVAAHALFREDELSNRWSNCRRIDAYLGGRLVHQVERVCA